MRVDARTIGAFACATSLLVVAEAGAQTIDVVGHWQFNGSSPTVAIDSSGNGHHGAIHGAVRVIGLTGGALLFDGVNDRVIVPHQASLDVSGAITIEAIIKSNGAQPPGFIPLIAKNVPGASATGYSLWVTGLTDSNTAFVYFHTPPWSIGEWHHIVFQHDGSVARFFVDGVLVVERPPGTVRQATPSSRFVEIGGSDNRSPFPGRGTFNGTIDQIRVSRGMLTPAQFLTINSAPNANAGLDQLVECAGPNGTPVTLNGLLSSDPDDDPLTFTWTGPFPEGEGTVTGGLPTVTLPLGAHVITMTVMDGSGEMSTDQVVVTIADTTAPSVTAALQPIAKADDDSSDDDDDSGRSDDDSSGDNDHHFQVVAQATDACDGSPIVVADINGHAVQDGEHVVIKLSGRDDRVRIKHGLLEFQGRRVVLTVTATDAAGNSKTEQVVLEKSKDDDDDS